MSPLTPEYFISYQIRVDVRLLEGRPRGETIIWTADNKNRRNDDEGHSLLWSEWRLWKRCLQHWDETRKWPTTCVISVRMDNFWGESWEWSWFKKNIWQFVTSLTWKRASDRWIEYCRKILKLHCVEKIRKTGAPGFIYECYTSNLAERKRRKLSKKWSSCLLL